MSDKYKSIDLDAQTVDVTVLRALSGVQAHRIRALPIGLSGDRLLVAADAPETLVERALELLTGHDVDLRSAPGPAIEQALARHYPDALIPESTEAERHLSGVIRHAALFGFDMIHANVGAAILAKCDRLRLRRPWEVTIEHQDGAAEPDVIEVDETPEGDRLFTGQRDLLNKLGETFRSIDEHVYEIPLRFFGDRIYPVTVDVRDDEVLLDIGTGVRLEA